MNVLVLATADWDAEIWTNKQHIAQRLATLAEVTYVDSLGLRRPRLSLADTERALRRAARLVRTPATTGDTRPEVTRVSPAVFPFHHPATRRVNSSILRRSLRGWLSLPRADRCIWTFSPITYDLEDEAAKTVYHCVDILEAFPGVNASAIRAGETRLAKKGVPAVASSGPVAEHLARVGFDSVDTWENVADIELFGRARIRSKRYEGRLVFAGNLHSQKVDFVFIEGLLKLVPDATLTLVGPVSDHLARRAVRRLVAGGRVVYEPPASQSRLAEIFASSTVGLIPYRLNRYTDGVLPMKLYEYLAAGLGVLATPLPALKGREGVMVVSSPQEGSAALRTIISPPTVEEIQRRFEIASEHSWDSRVAEIAARLGIPSTRQDKSPRRRA